MTIIKKFETEEPKKNFGKKYFVLALIGLFGLMIFEIWASNNTVTYGEKMEKLTSLSKTLIMENQILENEIAKKVSLNDIASKSAALGFLEPESIQYIR